MWDFGAQEALCVLRGASVHNVDGLADEEVVRVFSEFLGQYSDRLVVPANVAGFHCPVLTSTKCMGASINAWAAGAGSEPPVRPPFVSGFQLVGVDCATIKSGSHDLGLQVGIGKAFVRPFTPGLSSLYVHSLVDAFAKSETLSGSSGQVPRCFFEVR